MLINGINNMFAIFKYKLEVDFNYTMSHELMIVLFLKARGKT